MRLADGKGVWSWSPDAGTKLAKDIRQTTVAIKPDTGERVISRKTIAQGRSECSGVPVFTRVLSAFYLAREAAGAIVHPAFPAPSIFEGSG
jgi:hypothetical protein